jgi:fumarate hydratase class I
MAEFVYQNPFPVKEDTTKYRLITKDFVSTEEFNGRKILKVKPEGLELLAREAFFDVSFFLRSSHMRQLAAILEDPEASDNERFVAYTMIKNQVVSAEGKLPTCQDTGTAIIMAKKGEDVYTGVDDAMHLSKGIFDVWQQNYLRYSILAPLTMTEEKNTTTNLPAQIDIYSSSGNSYEFLIVTKGGGSANKSLLFQQTKSLLNEENLTKFFKEKISELGSAACPPYHLAIVIGGSSAEANLAVVKKASTGYYDNLPTQGNIYGQAFRDLEWEERIKKITQESGIGAQFGGKYFAHDVRVIRLPRHAASCPVGIGVKKFSL